MQAAVEKALWLPVPERSHAEARLYEHVLLAFRSLRAISDAQLGGLIQFWSWAAPDHMPHQAAFQALLAPFLDAYEVGGLDAIRKAAQPDSRFSLVDERPIAWLKRHGADLVTRLAREDREHLRAVLVDGMHRGMTAHERAKFIKPLIGLTEPHVEYIRGLRGLGATEAEIASESERLLQYRAMMIARTESTLAHGAGQFEAWQQAADRGLLDRATTFRRWVTTNLPCVSICDAMDGQEVLLDAPFMAKRIRTDGSVLWEKEVHWPGQTHAHCLCSVVLRIEPGAEHHRERIREIKELQEASRLVGLEAKRDIKYTAALDAYQEFTATTLKPADPVGALSGFLMDKWVVADEGSKSYLALELAAERETKRAVLHPPGWRKAVTDTYSGGAIDVLRQWVRAVQRWSEPGVTRIMEALRRWSTP